MLSYNKINYRCNNNEQIDNLFYIIRNQINNNYKTNIYIKNKKNYTFIKHKKNKYRYIQNTQYLENNYILFSSLYFKQP